MPIGARVGLRPGRLAKMLPILSICGCVLELHRGDRLRKI